MRASLKSNLRYTLYIIIGLSIIYGPISVAQGVVAVTPVELDFNFWFRGALSALLAILIYIAKGTENRLKKVEDRLHQFDQISAKREQIITEYRGKFTFLENETKEQSNTLQMLEKLILTNYHDKEETERHRMRVEQELREIKHKLENMARPLHRRQDDEQGHEHDR